MGLFDWIRADAPESSSAPSKVQSRVASLPTADLWSWGDNMVSEAGRHLTAAQRGVSGIERGGSLEEARIAASALQAVCTELQQRLDT